MIFFYKIVGNTFHKIVHAFFFFISENLQSVFQKVKKMTDITLYT